MDFEVRLESDEFPCDKLAVRSVTGREQISELFSFDILAASSDPAVRIEPGASATLTFSEDGNNTRSIHGIVADCVEDLEAESDAVTFRFRLVPHAHRLSLVQMQEAFVTTSVPDILRQKLELAGVLAELRLYAGPTFYTPRQFVVQYEESDLTLLRRLCEHLGISFFFEHAHGRDTLVLTDEPGGFGKRGAHSASYSGRGEHRGVFRLTRHKQLMPSLFGVSDYNDDLPHVDLLAIEQREDGNGGGVIEYGSHHRTPEEGARLAKMRAEESAARAHTYEGESTEAAFGAGRRVVIDGHPRLANLEVLIVGVEHRVATEANGRFTYGNRFVALPGEMTFRPPRVTHRPRISGLVSGIVRAAPGTEQKSPWIDAHGRYLVQMLFESANNGERHASLPIRMAQSSAGANYGMHFPLRPGTEVVIGFIGGDPDRPVIVGAVHNGVAPNLVTASESLKNRIKSASGIVVEMNDGR